MNFFLTQCMYIALQQSVHSFLCVQSQKKKFKAKTNFSLKKFLLNSL